MNTMTELDPGCALFIKRYLTRSDIVKLPLLFILGLCVGAWMNDVKWTDIISAVATTSLAALGFITFYRWSYYKRRDDAYIKAKDYLSALTNIKSILFEGLDFEFFHLCPKAGSIVESSETYHVRVEHVFSLANDLFFAHISLSRVKSELTFWKVCLSPSFEELHTSLCDDLGRLSTIMHAFCSQLHFRYFKDGDNLNEINRHEGMYNKCRNSIRQTMDKQNELGFDRAFDFE